MTGALAFRSGSWRSAFGERWNQLRAVAPDAIARVEYGSAEPQILHDVRMLDHDT